jgi:hypothetical protein
MLFGYPAFKAPASCCRRGNAIAGDAVTNALELAELFDDDDVDEPGCTRS